MTKMWKVGKSGEQNHDLTNPSIVKSFIDNGTLPPLPSPSMLETDLTDEWCNHGCNHCCFGSQLGTQVRQIHTKTYLEYAKSAYAHGTRAVELVGGGEPTVHRDIGMIVSELSAMPGMQIGMVTNGELLQKRTLAPQLEKFNWIRVSLDAGDEKTYMVAHGVKAGVFDRVKENARQAAKILRNNMGLGYLVVPGVNDSEVSMAKAVEFAEEAKMGHIAFRPVIDSGIPQEQWSRIASQVSALKAMHPQISVTGGLSEGSWSIVDGTTKRTPGMCTGRPLVQVIKADGEVPSCFLKRNQPLTQNIGNIRDGYDDCWAKNPHHLMSWFSEDIRECPTPCKFDRTNVAIQKRINGGIFLSDPPILPAGHQHFI